MSRQVIEVWFATDRHGRPIAYRWSRMQFRSFRIGLDEARNALATGEAVRIDGHPMRPR